MFPFWSSLILFVLLCMSAAFGFLIKSRLHEPQTSKESIELIHLSIGLLVTVAAVVLGLLTNSVKNAYDTAEHDRIQYAAQLTQLDLCLRNYGSGTELVRSQLRSYTAAAIASTWPSTATDRRELPKYVENGESRSQSDPGGSDQSNRP